jgi:hypothetical protein
MRVFEWLALVCCYLIQWIWFAIIVSLVIDFDWQLPFSPFWIFI